MMVTSMHELETSCPSAASNMSRDDEGIIAVNNAINVCIREVITKNKVEIHVK